MDIESLANLGAPLAALFILGFIIAGLIQATAKVFLPSISQMYKTASEVQVEVIKDLRRSVDRREERLTELGAKVEAMQVQIDALEDQVIQRDERIAGLEQQVLALKAQIEGLEKLVSSLNEQNAALKAERDTLKQKAESPEVK